jgi:hypothetical protein
MDKVPPPQNKKLSVNFSHPVFSVLDLLTFEDGADCRNAILSQIQDNFFVFYYWKNEGLPSNSTQCNLFWVAIFLKKNEDFLYAGLSCIQINMMLK